jgi:hypothetical protein
LALLLPPLPVLAVPAVGCTGTLALPACGITLAEPAVPLGSDPLPA